VNRLEEVSVAVFGCTAVLGIKRKIDLTKPFNTLKKSDAKSDWKRITNLKVRLHVVLLCMGLFSKIALSPCSDENHFRLLSAVAT